QMTAPPRVTRLPHPLFHSSDALARSLRSLTRPPLPAKTWTKKAAHSLRSLAVQSLPFRYRTATATRLPNRLRSSLARFTRSLRCSSTVGTRFRRACTPFGRADLARRFALDVRLAHGSLRSPFASRRITPFAPRTAHTRARARAPI